MEEEQSLRDCESYIQTHNIQRVLKDCIVQLCVIRPDNPVSFLRQYFTKLERVSRMAIQDIQKTIMGSDPAGADVPHFSLDLIQGHIKIMNRNPVCRVCPHVSASVILSMYCGVRCFLGRCV